MSYENDRAAYILANTYNFCPPHAVYPARARAVNTGKYEPDHLDGEETRVMVLAHFAGKTNMLIKFNNSELIP